MANKVDTPLLLPKQTQDKSGIAQSQNLYIWVHETALEVGILSREMNILSNCVNKLNQDICVWRKFEV